MLAIERMQREGVRPTLRSIGEATGRVSLSRISENIDMLVVRGFVVRNPRNGTIVQIRTIAEEIAGTPISDDPMVLFVDRHQKLNDATTPSHQEICDALGIASKNTVNRKLAQLVRIGHLRVPSDHEKLSIKRCLHVVKRDVGGVATLEDVRDNEGKTDHADL